MTSEKDITFASGAGVDLEFDSNRPAGPGTRTAILYFHGGGWCIGSREAMRSEARAMAALGFVGLDRTIVDADEHRAEIEPLSVFARREAARPR